MATKSLTTLEVIENKEEKKTIATVEYIQLNNVYQCITIRSYNISNPLLLYFHGGPGISEMPLIRHYNHDLEQYYTIVYWEQRGTGKSFNSEIPDSTYHISQFLDDAYTLSNYLLQRFKKDKLFIMGHSWGTIIATQLALKHPELCYAYIGIGQVVDMDKGEKLSYSYVLNRAKESNNNKAIKELQQITDPPYLTIENNKSWYEHLKIERKWLIKFGGLILNKTKYFNFVRLFMNSFEYSMFDLVRFAQGSSNSVKKLWPEAMKVNFINQTTEFQIPVFFIQGKFDYNCPTELVTDFFRLITAPQKELFIFDNSAHAPNYEESDRFNNVLMSILKLRRS